MVTLVSLLQLKNALSPMVSTPSEMVTLVRLVHPKNALSPMVFVPGMVTLSRLLQP